MQIYSFFIMLVHIFGAKCIGINAVKVTVEVDITPGIGIHLCGLGDAAVKESLLRIVTALQSLGYHVPGKKIVINLAPAHLHKNGSGYDLPIAIGIVAASSQKLLPLVSQTLIMGELGLDGSVRPIRGGLPIADFAQNNDFKYCILPYDSAMEASSLDGIKVYGVRTLAQVIEILEGSNDVEEYVVNGKGSREPLQAGSAEVDFADIIGQRAAKRAMEIAAAGGHNLIMIGTPGSGKSSLAKALAGILPPMSKEEAFMCSKIYSIAGRGNSSGGLMWRRPFRSPHYSAPLAALLGGGSGSENIIPGEVTLAHLGVLFLDEFNLMPKSVMEALRAPLEDGKVLISRLKAKVEYPADFTLVAAANPCPCGYYGEGDRCSCTPAQRHQFLSRLSGPIMDRMDLQVLVRPITSAQLRNRDREESSEQIALRVLECRRRQQERFEGSGINSNSSMTNRQIMEYCHLNAESEEFMTSLMETMALSMRAYYRIIRVARTIADLEGSDTIKAEHLMEAAGYRILDKQSI
ncbi:MAG: YifB family Mg chelatase-like AAA ATPase [Candidatus Cryptobacteroides sp.]